MNRSGQKAGRPIWMLFAKGARQSDFHQLVAASEPFDDAPLQTSARPQQPVAILALIMERIELAIVDVVAVEDRYRPIGYSLNERPSHFAFARMAVGKIESQPQMAAQNHQHRDPYLRIGRRSPTRAQQ